MHAERQMPAKVFPEGYAALRHVGAYIRSSCLPQRLIELVMRRASQINWFADCLDMHSRYARKHGETEQRLYVLSGWRESPLNTPAERAALAWTEAVTLISETQAPESDYEALAKHFS